MNLCIHTFLDGVNGLAILSVCSKDLDYSKYFLRRKYVLAYFHFQTIGGIALMYELFLRIIHFSDQIFNSIMFQRKHMYKLAPIYE